MPENEKLEKRLAGLVIDGEYEVIREEAADVANLAMMISDLTQTEVE